MRDYPKCTSVDTGPNTYKLVCDVQFDQTEHRLSSKNNKKASILIGELVEIG
jgi:hypothetical protein